jgi:hypothetical protein
MKTQIISTLPSGYGHKEIKIRYSNGKEYSAVTNDMPVFDDYNRDDSELFTRKDYADQKRAEKSLIWFVKNQNELR